MTILVTGATGFLGSALVTELIRQKQPVRILARDEQKARAQFGDAVTIIVGDINDEEQVRRAVDGATIIYHLVGRLYHPSTPPELYYRTHVEGTRILLNACKGQSQLQRIVHCSTTGVHGETGRTTAAEDAPFAPTIAHSLDKELPGGSIPLWLANLASDIFALTPGMRGEQAPLTRSRVKFLTRSRVYDISRAQNDLGFSPRVQLEEGMKRTAAWYHKHKYL